MACAWIGVGVDVAGVRDGGEDLRAQSKIGKFHSLRINPAVWAVGRKAVRLRRARRNRR